MNIPFVKHSLGLAGIVVLAAACQDTSVNRIQGELLVPTLTDVGDVPVGSTYEFPLAFANSSGGEGFDIENITINNIEGDYFDYGDEATPWALGRDENRNVLFTYNPLEEGYHLATVNILNSGRRSEVQATVRGHGALAAVSVWPLVLDFGPVNAGFTRSLEVTVSNDGDVPLDVLGASTTDPQYTVDADFSEPIQILVGDIATFTVSFSPSVADPQPASSAELSFDLGDFVTAPTVVLRANDCENGDPSEYDVDRDGFTSCGGDCDDFDDLSYPGAQEVCDGADNDCDANDADGAIDEDSTCWDDDGDGYCEGGDADGDGIFDCLNGDPNVDHTSVTNLDCNDGIGAGLNVNPGETEVLGNGIDDDCDGQVDQGSTDADGDGYSPGGGDCDDSDGTSYPGGQERPDNRDNDCDDIVDEGTIRYDDDGDCFCEATSGSCNGSSEPNCTSIAIRDCNDAEALTNPNATEAADYQDNDCDTRVDEGTNYADDDGDGFTEDGGDCDDNNASVWPGNGCP